MKKVTLLLLFLLQFIQGFSQSEPFVKVGTNWSYGSGDEGTNPYYSFFMGNVCRKLEVVNGKSYSAIFTIGHTPNDSQTEATYFLRKENRKVYYLWKGNEYLFFDFNKNLHDSVEIDIREYSFSVHNPIDTVIKAKVYISSIDSIKNGIANKEYHTIYRITGNRGWASATISEDFIKINGHSNHNFISLREYSSIPEYIWKIRCFNEPGNIDFISTQYANLINKKYCNYSGLLPLYVGLKNLEKFPQMNIYPNPFINKIEINLERQSEEELEIILINALGQTLKKYPMSIGIKQVILNLEDLDKGFYFLNLVQESYVIQSNKIIKQ